MTSLRHSIGVLVLHFLPWLGELMDYLDILLYFLHVVIDVFSSLLLEILRMAVYRLRVTAVFHCGNYLMVNGIGDTSNRST